MNAAAATIRTIGHSTLAWPEFLGLLQEHAIDAIADVRRFPASRRHPQFGADALAPALAAAGVAYRHFGALGGRRAPRADSPNRGWRHPAFRGYADHMASAEYRAAFAALAMFASARRAAILCAERHWWDCHRALLADDLALHGWRVVHVLGAGCVAAHAFREPVRLVDGVPVYDGGQERLL